MINDLIIAFDGFRVARKEFCDAVSKHNDAEAPLINHWFDPRTCECDKTEDKFKKAKEELDRVFKAYIEEALKDE